MSQGIRNIILLMLVMGAVGCARLDSIYREHDFNEGSALIDAKQRALLSKYDFEKGLMICAEPSPDALSAYAAELSAKADLPESIAVELAGAFQESSSFIGLRTQSIQLLRDGFYRLCEARMNNVIDDDQYALLLRRQQRITVALLAIEQLTGALKVPTVAVNTQGTAKIASNVDEMVAQKQEKDKEIAEKEDAKKKITGSTAEDNAAKAALDAEITELVKSRDVLIKGIENGRSLVATGSATAVVHADGMPTQRSDAHIQAIAGYVDKIVKYTQTDDFGEMCFIHLGKGDPSSGLTGICTKYLEHVGRQQEALRGIMDAFKARILAVPIKDANDIKIIAEALKLLSDIGPGGGFMGVPPATVKSTKPETNANPK